LDKSSILASAGNLRIKRTRHGLMAYNVNDAYIGLSLDCYGEYSPGEMHVFAQVIKPGASVIEVGANIGAHTLFLARAVGPEGSVVAIEPQGAIFQLLCTNLAINEIGNVRAIHAGAGREPGRAFIPRPDYGKPGNFGAIALSKEGGEPIDVVTIDELHLSACHFIKIDAEGSEQPVIAGAVNTIDRFHPILYVENDRPEKSPELIRQLRALDYVLYWHIPPYYSADNFYQNSTDLFPQVVSINMLCLTGDDTRKITGMRRVSSSDEWLWTGQETGRR
jgi:FkbM family methyltransferase